MPGSDEQQRQRAIEWLEFTDSLPTEVILDQFRIVHAGYQTHIPLEDQTDKDRLKSRTRGYASLDYQFDGYQAEDLVQLQILVNLHPVDALATIVHRDSAYQKGQMLITKLKKLIPRQLFPVAIQAATDGKVISRANVKALRKDVLAKCYGGDVTRKKKLLARQKKGRKRLKMVGNVEIPQQAFMAVLRLGE